MSAREVLQTAWERVRVVPLPFLGMAFYRTWISVLFTESPVDSGIGALPWGMGRIDFLDVGCVAVMLACALLFRRIGMLHEKRRLQVCVTLTMSALSAAVALRFELGAPLGALDAALSAACGACFGFTIILWAEAYACLNPLNVALYYSVSLVFEQFLIFMVTQYPAGFSLWVSAALPLVSLACYARAVRRLPQRDLPHPTQLKTTLPWKIILLTCLSSFTQGMVSTYSFSHGIPTYLGILTPSLVVLASVLLATRRFNFHTTYSAFLPLMAACVVFAIPLQAAGADGLAEFFAIAANRTVVLLMFVLLCGMVQTYRLSAVLLFSVERACMLAASVAGRALGTATDIAHAPLPQVGMLTAFAGILMAVFLYLFFSERYLSSTWGVVFKGAPGEEREELAIVRAVDLARAHALSERETEVMLAAIQGRSIREMEEELVIANGTVKAHLQHIYRKFGVHSKRELCELVGASDNRREE